LIAFARQLPNVQLPFSVSRSSNKTITMVDVAAVPDAFAAAKLAKAREGPVKKTFRRPRPVSGPVHGKKKVE
jgi:hypothetical protein